MPCKWTKKGIIGNQLNLIAFKQYKIYLLLSFNDNFSFQKSLSRFFCAASMPIPNGHIIIRGFLKISESGITYMAALMSSIMLAILLITINLFTSYDNCFGVQEEIFFKDSPGAEKFLVESAETRNGTVQLFVYGQISNKKCRF